MNKLILFGICILFLLGLKGVSAGDISSCGILSTDNTIYTLTQDVNSTGTCFNITSNNSILNCNGYLINYSTSITGYGIIVDKANQNVTIKNCNIIDNGTGGINSYGIYITGGAKNITITNNTIKTTKQSGHGIIVQYDGTTQNTGINITGNTINVNTTSGTAGDGIYFYAVANSIISYNNIIVSGDLPIGIAFDTSSSNNRIENNIVIARNETANGIQLVSSCHYNNISNNNVTADRYALFTVTSDNNNIYNNFFISKENYSLWISTGSDTNKIYNNFINGSSIPALVTTTSQNSWNTTKQIGTRIYSGGINIGGNYWTNSSGNGYSDTCTDLDKDGFCDTAYNVTSNLASVGTGLNVDYLPLSDEYIIPDTTSPSFSSNSTNASSTTYNGGTVQINLTIKDSSNISAYTLSTTDTSGSTWANETIVNLDGLGNVTMVWNYTISNFPLSGGTFSWRVWANDTLGNSGVSDIYTFTVGNSSAVTTGLTTAQTIAERGQKGLLNMTTFFAIIGTVIGVFILLGIIYLSYVNLYKKETIEFKEFDMKTVMWIIIQIVVVIMLAAVGALMLDAF